MACSSKPILLVEDDRVDTMTVQRAFKDLHIANPLHCVGNGQEALEYLEKNPENHPCIILLDLNMPKMGGVEFLRIRRRRKSLRKIPVVVLTVSTEEESKLKSYDLGVAGYIVKPVDYHKFVEAVRAVHMYWTVCEIPG